MRDNHCLEVYHPQHLGHVRAAVQQNGKWFVAFSVRSYGSAKLAAVMINQDPNQANLQPCVGQVLFPKDAKSKAKTLLQCVIGFKDLPDPTAAGTRYHVFVGHRAAVDDKKGCRALSLEVIVDRPATVRAHRSDTRTTIPVQGPGAQDILPSTFRAWGTNATAPPNFSQLDRPGFVVSGTVIDDVPPGIWMYEFANIPDNSDYTFTVRLMNGMNVVDEGIVGDLTVNSLGLMPVGATIPGDPPPGP